MVKKIIKNCLWLLPWILVSFFVLSFSTKTFYKSAYPTFYSDFVDKYSQECGVDKALIYAVIRTESGFKHNAISSAQAKGLMQITKDTYEWAQSRKQIENIMEHDTLYDPETNIEFGTYILFLLSEEFGVTETTIAAYHAGWGNVKSWLSDESHSTDGINLYDIPFPSTKKYVEKVMLTSDIYKKLYDM
ncbi:MAG: lytic transglycosylase domain-containing protein [Oscillospiraceae bacterium]